MLLPVWLLLLSCGAEGRQPPGPDAAPVEESADDQLRRLVAVEEEWLVEVDPGGQCPDCAADMEELDAVEPSLGPVLPCLFHYLDAARPPDAPGPGCPTGPVSETAVADRECGMFCQDIVAVNGILDCAGEFAGEARDTSFAEEVLRCRARAELDGLFREIEDRLDEIGWRYPIRLTRENAASFCGLQNKLFFTPSCEDVQRGVAWLARRLGRTDLDSDILGYGFGWRLGWGSVDTCHRQQPYEFPDDEPADEIDFPLADPDDVPDHPEPKIEGEVQVDVCEGYFLKEKHWKNDRPMFVDYPSPNPCFGSDGSQERWPIGGKRWVRPAEDTCQRVCDSLMEGLEYKSCLERLTETERGERQARAREWLAWAGSETEDIKEHAEHSVFRDTGEPVLLVGDDDIRRFCCLNPRAISTTSRQMGKHLNGFRR